MNKFIIFLIVLCCAISAQSQPEKATRLGIPNFLLIANSDDQKKYDWLEVGFSESLTDAFSRVPKFNVIERSQVSKILKEQSFQKSINDTTTIVNTGRILGIDMMLVGSCQVTTGYALVNMRIVNVESGEVAHLNNLPIITPVDSILFLQKKLCLEVLNQFQVSNKEKIVHEIEKATSSSTNNFKAYEFLNKGLELYANQQYKEAIDMYTRALFLDKKYEKAYFNRAESRFAIQDFSNAVDDYKKVETYIKKDSVYILISDAYQKQGMEKKSIEYLKMAKKLNPKNLIIDKKLNAISQLSINASPPLGNVEEPETVFEYKNGIARIKKDGKYGFIDVNNKIVIPLNFDDLRDFSNGLAAAKVGSRWGFIDSSGKMLIEPIYNDVSNFDKHGLAKVIKKLKWGIINTMGNIIVPIEFEREAYIFSLWESSEYIVTCKSSGILGLEEICGVYDRKGKLILPVIYDEIKDRYRFRPEKNEYPYFHVSFKKQWGVVDKNNNVIIPFSYQDEDCIRDYTNGFAAVKVNERWGFLNDKGLQVIPFQYEKVNDFKGTLFEVRNKAKWGAVDANNVFKIPMDFENLQYLENGYYGAEKNDKWGILNSDGDTICDFIYDEMGSSIRNEFIRIFYSSERTKLHVEVKINGANFYIDENCKCVSDCK